jgi:integrase
MGVTVYEWKGAWWLTVHHQGKRRRKRVGKGPQGKKAANLAAVQLRAKLASGEPAMLAPTPVTPTFKAYSEQWLREAIVPHRKTRTADYYRQIIADHLVPVFGSDLVTAITPAMVRTFIAEKLTRGASRNTVKNMAATLRAILYQAQQVDGLITSNPAARFGKHFNARHDAREHVVVLEPEDVGAILTAAGKWYPDHEPAVQVLFMTGTREGELLGLQWTDIDWTHNLIDLRRTVGSARGA